MRGVAGGAERRRELERWLADCGLAAGPRRKQATGEPASGSEVPERFGSRLAQALAGAGPLFAAYGRYLGTRADQLRLADCLALLEIADAAPPVTGEALHHQLSELLGRPVDICFSELDATPYQSRLLYQSHRALLPDGRPVLVHLLSRGRRRRLEDDLELLSLLDPVFSAEGIDPAGVAADFRRALAGRLDLTVAAQALEGLRRDVVDDALLLVPEVHSQLTTPSVLTLDDPGGICLEGAPRDGGRHGDRQPDGSARSSTGGEPAGGAPRTGNSWADPRWEGGRGSASAAADPPRATPRGSHTTARRLALAVLQQALVAGTFPVEAEVVRLDDGRLAFTGGFFATLPSAAQPNLWRYLQAAAVHQPDQAASCLLRESVPTAGAVGADELDRRLRQVVPFRDGAWSEHGDRLADYLLLHWQRLREGGYRPRSHLLVFFQAMFWTARVGKQLAPEDDPLARAQEDLRWLAAWHQLRELADPRQMGDRLEAGLALLLELPQKLDRVLELATGEEAQLRLRVARSPARHKLKRKVTKAAATGLCMVSVAVATAALSRAGVGGGWLEGAGAVLFALLGALLLVQLGGRE